MSYASRTITSLTRFGQSGAPGLEALITFALLSIRRQFNLVGEAITMESRGDLVTLKSVREGIAYVQSNRAGLYAAVNSVNTTEDVIDELLAIPGLGLVKAGFVAQMLGYDVGCIDSNNARMFGIGRRFTRFEKGCTARTRRAKIAAYIALCQRLGGTEYLWTVWCEYVAATYPDSFPNGEASGFESEW